MNGSEYADERLLKVRRQQEEAEKEENSKEVIEQESKQSIYDDMVMLFKIPVVFEDRSVLGNRATIRMPKDFEERSPEEIASVYFNGTRPQFVFSNGYLRFMLALNWTENMVSDANIPDFSQFAKIVIGRIGPKSKIMGEEKVLRQEGNLSILQFLAQTIESVNMNVMFFTSLEGRLLIGSITFNQKDAQRLLPLAIEMAKSFHITCDKEKK